MPVRTAWVDAERTGLPVGGGDGPSKDGKASRPAVLLGMAVVAGVGVLRIQTGYWNDEAITVGIAGHPLLAIPGVLRHDGSPPAFYLVLHLWMAVAGTRPAATHLLTLAAAVAVVPAAARGAGRLFGRRASLMATALTAGNPYLWWYGTETRMYSSLALVSVLAASSWAEALVTGRRRAARGGMACAVAAVYLHDWGWWLVAGMAAAGILAASRGTRGAWRRTACLLVAVGLAYLPWVGSAVFQALHTGAPWASVGRPAQAVIDPLWLLAGPSWAGWVLMLACLLAAWPVARSRWGRRRADGVVIGVWGRAGEGRALGLLAIASAATVATSWCGALVSHAWVARYLATAMGPLVLLAAGVLGGPRLVGTGAQAGVGRAVRWSGLLGAGAVFGGALAGLLPAADRGTAAKSNAAAVAHALRPLLRAGDLVDVTQTSQVPLIAYYLGPSLRYSDPIGPALHPSYVDWVDLPARLRAADEPALVTAEVDRMRRGQQLVLIGPPAWAPSRGYGAEVGDQGVALEAAVAADPRLHLVQDIPAIPTRVPITAALYLRT